MLPLPPVDPSFYWIQASWGAALRCRALDPLAPHLFTTRQLELSADGYRALAVSLGARRTATLSQVHGAAVVAIRRGAPPPGGSPEGDVLVSDDPDVALVVRAADCVPLLMADRSSGAVAAVHAGWRGTAARAATAALDALAREFGTRPSDIVAAIGPSIGACCYEVGSDVVDAFAAAGHERYLIDRWFPTPRVVTAVEGPPAPGSRERRRLRLDVAGANRDQLILAGVPDEQIHAANLCTAMHLDVLTSYRVEKEKAGRIAGAIRAR